MANAELTAALVRVKAVVARVEPADTIDEERSFTAADLQAIIDAAEVHADVEPAGSMTADDLGNMA